MDRPLCRRFEIEGIVERVCGAPASPMSTAAAAREMNEGEREGSIATQLQLAKRRPFPPRYILATSVFARRLLEWPA